MGKEQGQAAFPHQPPESEASFDGLIDLVADSMRHAIGVQRQAHQAVAQLTDTAITHKKSLEGLDAGVDKVLRELPVIVANKVGEKFNKAADGAATTISQHLKDANEGVRNAAEALTKASSELRSSVEADFMRRILLGGGCFLGGSLFGAMLVNMFGR